MAKAPIQAAFIIAARHQVEGRSPTAIQTTQAESVFPEAAYSGKGGVSPLGRGTWNTFSVFPISV